MTNNHRCYQGGRSAYQDIIRGFYLCRDGGLDPGVSCTLSEEGVRNYDKVMSMLLDELPITSIGFNMLLSNPESPVTAEYSRTASLFMIKAFEALRKLGIHEDRMMRKVQAFIDGQVYPFDCGACGGGQIVVAPDGQVGICHGYVGERKFFPTTVTDSKFDPRKDLLFMEWSRRSPLNMDKCQDCIALGACGGGCPLQAEKDTGSIWGLDERFCIHATETLKWLIKDLYKQETKFEMPHP